MINPELSKTRLTAEAVGFIFYLYEFYIFFHSHLTVFVCDGSPEIFVFRAVLF
jgi:hypothetical protein